MDEDLSLAIALSLQDNPPHKSNEEVKKESQRQMSVVDPLWETIDPNPCIFNLFIQFNKEYFWGRLDMVEVKWSPQMTLCAGVCSYQRRGGLCSVRLSKPLLQFRPRKDLVETLLHEMIHAYLFVTHNNKDHDDHGTEFHKHMFRINKHSGSNITVYHSFHDEVAALRKHWWRCDGPCRNKRPFYGWVKRAKNRAPSKNDRWWAAHQLSCGGSFIKVKEPEGYQDKKNKKTKKQKAIESGVGKSGKQISEIFSPRLQTKIVNGVLTKTKIPVETKNAKRKSPVNNKRKNPISTKQNDPREKLKTNADKTSETPSSKNSPKTKPHVSTKVVVAGSGAKVYFSSSEDEDLVLSQALDRFESRPKPAKVQKVNKPNCAFEVGGGRKGGRLVGSSKEFVRKVGCDPNLAAKIPEFCAGGDNLTGLKPVAGDEMLIKNLLK